MLCNVVLQLAVLVLAILWMNFVARAFLRRVARQPGVDAARPTTRPTSATRSVRLCSEHQQEID